MTRAELYSLSGYFGQAPMAASDWAAVASLSFDRTVTTEEFIAALHAYGPVGKPGERYGDLTRSTFAWFRR